MPVERWSAAQVQALAPDAGSLKGARSVAGAAAWQASGLHDTVLWGLCRGSGARPYQVCVDLAGPAYRCSCPSRKFPCKHALGLLLLRADGNDGGAPAPPWVAEWQAGRAARAARTDPARTGSAPADPEAAARRARQRGERVATGMAELRRWLDDQMQQGLAGAGPAGHGPYDAMAARLVDAQAPTVAGAVRRAGRLVGLGPHWADRLLGELALLRLLASAHERLGVLPDDLAATVRSRIGFPVSTAEVRAGPAVRDRWQVLGQVDSEDDRVITRSTWLHGARTGRFALLLAFAGPGAAFAADVVPGTEFDADLHFHPGVAPLRAVLGDRHTGSAPLTAPVGAVGVRAALGGWSAALAAEPWRSAVPVLLAGVAPSADGHLVDAADDGLPLVPGHREPWWLLAAAGGAPVTVAGLWSPAGLRPLAAWPGDRYVPAAPALPGPPGGAPELPADLLAAALIGTARRPWPGRGVRVGDRELTLAGARPDPGGLLEAAAVAVTYRRAAVLPVAGRRPVSAAPADAAAEVPPAAGARLRLMLGDGAAGGPAAQELLAEWLTAAAHRHGVVPAEALPALLDAGRRDRTIRPALAAVAGARGRWLAARRPEWRYLLAEAASGGAPAAPPDPTRWEAGPPGERAELLARLRGVDPAAGRELLAGTFAAESAEDRARFLEALATGLSPADDAFLERALDDRRREVRDVALSLLRRLPGSSFGRRMAARATACVRLERRALGRDRLIVTAPSEIDAGLRRDGLPARPPPQAGVGGWLLEEIVAGAPLDTWTDLTGRRPAGVLELAEGSDWSAPLLHGWARAATAQRDAAWAAALVTAAERVRPGRPGALPQELAWDLHLILPPADLARFAADALRDDPARAYRLLGVGPRPWPDELAAAVVEQLARQARTDRHAWHLAELCRFAGPAMPHHVAGEVTRLADRLEREAVDPARLRPVARLAATLTFRHEMHQELS